MRSVYFPCLLATILLVGIPLSAISQAAQVDVQIRLATADAVEVSYILPENCPGLSFIENGDGKKLRASWQALDDCGTVGDDKLGRGSKICATLRFRIPATTSKIPGYYATAFPMGGGVVYVHTSTYAVSDACGKARYQLMAPGSIAMAGKVYQGQAVANADTGGDTSALLLPSTLPPQQGTISYFDPRMSAAAVEQVKQVADGTVSFLSKALPDARFRPAILAASLANEPGGSNVGGEAGDVLRLSFYNWPQQPSPRDQQQMTLLVAHELSHRFQLRDAVDGYPDARLIHEGGAEFLRWMTSVKNGWLTHQQAADDLNNALTQCILNTSQKNWRDLSPGTKAGYRLEYVCGLPAYVYGLAARQGSGTALSRFNDFYKELALGKTPDFSQALECGSNTQCQPQWLPQLLGQSGTMSEQWDKLFAATTLATPHAPKAIERDAMMQQAITKLMRDDCDGHRDLTVTPDGIVMGGMRICKSFRSDSYLIKVEEHPVFGNDLALSAMIAACSERHAVNLGMKDGSTLVVACASPYQERKEFYGADIEKILLKLNQQ